MTRQSVTYSFILHSLIILLAAELHFYDFFKGKKQSNQDVSSGLENVVKLDLGAMQFKESESMRTQWNMDSYQISNTYGVDSVNYGRMVSQILLERLQSKGIDVGQNRVKIILTISKNGKLLAFDLHLKESDSNLQADLEDALNSNLIFPYNRDAKKQRAKYQVFLSQ